MKKLSSVFYLLLLSSGVLLAQKIAPDAPAKLGATTASTSRINLTGLDNSTNETGFEIERSTNGTTFVKIADVAANVTTYGNTGLAQDTKYYYRVRAVNSIGASGYTNTADATTLSRAPIAPTGLAATAASTSQINLTWKDNSTNETEFQIERSTNGTTFAKIATVNENVTTYANTGLTQDTKYYYRVRAVEVNIDIGTFTSAYSNTADATTLSFTPNAPTGLVAATVSVSQINLSWKDNATNESGFEIERSTNGTTFTKIGDAGPNTTAFPNTGLSGNTKYYYRIRAVNKDYPSAYSNTADATTLANLPAAPTDLVATTISTSQINLAWKDNATNETDFEIERSTDGNNFTKIATVTANTTTYQNTGLTENTKYYYRVRAYNKTANTYSGYSNTANATTQSNAPKPPAAPVIDASLSQNWTKNSDRVTEITASWQDKSTDETGFDIQWGDSDQYSGGSASVGANMTQYKIDSSWPGCGQKVYVRVRSKNAAGESAWSSAIVTTGIALPETPNNIVATAKSASEIELKWGGANESFSRESRFVIQYSTSNSFTSPTEVQSEQNTESKTMGGLTANTTYYFRIKTQNCAGESAWSAPVSAKTQEAPVQAPAAPTDLVATTISTSQINMVWKDNATNETDFEIERSTDGNNFTKIATVTANTTTYQNTGLSQNTKYYYRVRAYNKAASTYSGYSNTADATTQGNTINAPSDLTLTPLLADNMNNVRLTWKDNSADETGFEVESSTNGTTFIKATTTAANVTQYEINLTTSTKNYFRVRAIKGGLASGYTNIVDYDMGPESPLDLKATAVSSSQINLEWSDRSTDETGYELERSVDGMIFTKIATLGANVVSYANTGLSANTLYYYRVRGVKGSAGSAYAHIVNAKTQENPVVTKPDTPKNLVAAAISSSQINLAWTDTTTNGDGFDIERSTDNLTWGNLVSVGATITTYTVTGLTANTKYYFRVRAQNKGGTSNWSNVAEANTLPVSPDAPKNLTAVAVSSSQINLVWVDATTNETGFELEQSIDGKSFTKIADVGANMTTYQNTGLTANTKYYYRVRAINPAGASAYSNIAEATTLTALGAPDNLMGTATGNSVSLVWRDNASIETGFELERAINGASFEKLGSLAANSIAYKDEHLRAQSRYTYRIRAVNGSTTSAFSNTATVSIIITDLSAIAAEVLLFPNPARDKITVGVGQSPHRWQFIVRNGAGQSILQSAQETSSTTIELSVEALPTGVYFLEISNPVNHRIVRFVKQ